MNSAMRSILAATLLGVAAACIAQRMLALDEFYVARVAAMLATGAVVLLWRLSAHHPFGRLGIANQITLSRGVLIVLLSGLIGAGTATGLQLAACGIAVVASVLDAVDGWSARRTAMSSAYGARFDMETDALLILVLSMLALQFGKAGVWVLLSGLLRYGFVGASSFLPWLRRPLPASLRRKTIAAAQTVCLLVAIATFVPVRLSQWLCAVALIALIGSFLVDIVWLRRHALDAMTLHRAG